jgi:hypothetical protein
VRGVDLDQVVHGGRAGKPMVSMAEGDITLVILATDVWLQADEGQVIVVTEVTPLLHAHVLIVPPDQT